ncbi:MAG TPA: ABC transporter ATP-binding protein [Candidatus Cloacimonetes bacterium]|nr:ABC transporter ATP-binding protein [Candidatus Cloacimonadota bacterium]
MEKKETRKNRRSNLALLYGMMFRYWPYVIAGLISMVLFALFSGVSVTVLVPLFDYVFTPQEVAIVHHNPAEIFSALSADISGFVQSQGSLFKLRSFSQLSPLWEALKETMMISDSISLLYLLCIVMMILIVLKNLSYFANRAFFIVLRGRTVKDMRDYMFGRYLNQSLEFFSKNKVGDAIVRMVNDVEIVSNQYINAIFNGLRDITSVVVYMYIALFLNAELFLYSILIVPLLAFTVGYLGKKIKKYSKRIQSQLSVMFNAVEEVLNSIKIVKAFRREEHEHKEFEKINKRHLKLWQKSQIYAAMSVPFSELNSVLTGVVVVILGGKMILDPASNFSLGDFTAFLFAVFSMLHPLKVLSQLYADIKKAGVSLDRIALVLNDESDIKDHPDMVSKDSFDNQISFENVDFYYKAGTEVIKNLSLTIKKGEKVAFVGASGGGKTTVTNLVNRMYDVKSGAIKIDGIDIRMIRLDDLRHLFGVVTQESILFSKSVRDNIAYGAKGELSDETIKAAAQIAHAEEFILQFPDGYDQVLDTKGQNLSGGQRQRLCIARAIVGDPPILIFDEATSALDTESEKMVQDAINEATKNRTVIMVAHRLSTILESDKIFVLDKGEVISQGSHEELLKNCPRYQYLCELQFGIT